MTDWMVWPLFVIQLVAFLLFFLKQNKSFLRLSMQQWITFLLLLTCLLIVLSVMHDSTDALKLYF